MPGILLERDRDPTPMRVTPGAAPSGEAVVGTPALDGLDAIAAIREHERLHGLPPVPILVLSADSQEKTRHVVLAHGASGFITKPVDPRLLVDAVEGQSAA